MGNLIFVGDMVIPIPKDLVLTSPALGQQKLADDAEPTISTKSTRTLYLSKIHLNPKTLYLVRGKDDALGKKSYEFIKEEAKFSSFLAVDGLERFINYVESKNEYAAIAYYAEEDFEALKPILKERIGWNLDALIGTEESYAVHTYSPPQ